MKALRLKIICNLPGFYLILGLLTACSEDVAQHTYQDIYFHDIPDLQQANPGTGFSRGGSTYCAPVAVSNSLAWLKGNTSREDQIQLAIKLASPDYMSTSPYSGTPPAGVVRGVARHLELSGQEYRRLEYAGWRPVQSRYRAQFPLSKQWLLEGLGPRSAVWLNLGWYKTPVPGYYQRIGGHWVVLVGYQQGHLMINDPGPWAGDNIDPQSLMIQSRQPLLVRTEQDYLIPAPTIIEIKKARAPDGVRAYIDGAIILELTASFK